MKLPIESMTQALLDSFPKIIFWKSTDLKYLGANKQFITFAGIDDINQLIDKTDRELPCSSEYQKYFSEGDTQVLATEKPLLSIKETLFLGNKEKIIICTDKYPIYNHEHKFVGILGVGAVEAYHKNSDSQTLENLIEVLPYYIFWKDADFIYRGCNKKFANLINKTPQEIIGKTDFDLGWGKNEAELFRLGDQEVLTGHAKVNVEETLVNPDNSRTVMLVNKIPLIDADENYFGVMGTSIDITDRKIMEESLRQAKLAAEAASRTKSEFIANISHDVRTPLSGMLLMAEHLKQKIQNPEEYQQIDILNKSGNRLLELLNGVLETISTENLRENDVIEKTFNLRELLQSLVELETPKTTTKNLDLKISIDNNLPELIVSDQQKIHRILLNLLGNAIKFTEKGSVTIQAKLISEKDGKDQIEFAIVDTGIGIPDKVQGQVFDRFFRVDPSYKSPFKGSGLGLYIAQKYVALLGGQIQLKSKLGVGTTFYFSLSLKEGKKEDLHVENKEIKNMDNTKVENNFSNNVDLTAPSAMKIYSENETETLRSLNVLLVEDDMACMLGTSYILQELDCHVQKAESAEDALKIIKTDNLDMIVTDIGLPNLSGEELIILTRYFETSSGKKPVPIVALTGHANTRRKELIALGVSEVLPKPPTLSQMETIINQFVLSKGTVTTASMKKSQTEEYAGHLGFELPKTEEELYQINQIPILDPAQEAEIKKNIPSIIDYLEQGKNELENLYKMEDWALLSKTAHRMKGGSLTLGLLKMAKACQYLERYYLAGHRTELKKLYKQLMETLAETHLTLQKNQ